MSDLNKVAESNDGTLYDSNGFLIAVLSGSYHEMGAQYGALMVEHMQKAHDVLIEPGRKSGAITDNDAKKWTDRAVTTCSTKYRQFYNGVVEGSGWPIDKVGMLDQINEFGLFQSKLHSFAGCTSILSWGSCSADGGMYIGRNMDWGSTFTEFPQVLTVLRPTDGSYKYASVGWPGMYCPFTALNEQGVYLDAHDGSSMGGSVIYEERPSTLHSLADMMAEVPSLAAPTAKADIHKRSCLLYPRKRTCAAHAPMSAMGQQRTSIIFQSAVACRIKRGPRVPLAGP